MLVKGINIVNKQIQLINVNFDFTSNGVYIFDGENGTGKTSTLKQLVFGKYKAYFDNEEIQRAFDNNQRYKIFSYVPQYIVPSKISIRDYLFKSGEVDTNKAVELLKIFELNLSPHDYIDVLSGGERTKIAIISALLKNTPYLLMDEPTNHLDDQSIVNLVEVLNKYADDKVLIVVTHDDRMINNLRIKKRFTFYRTGIVENNYSCVSNKDKELSHIHKIPWVSIMFKISKNRIHILSLVMTNVLLIVLMFYANMSLERSYANTFVGLDDTIFVYSVDKSFSQWNKDYTKNERITIEDNKVNQMILYNSIEDIASKPFVESVYLYDFLYIDTIMNKIHSGAAIDEISLVSMPEFIYMNYLPLFDYPFGTAYVDGKLPKDQKNEVAISKKLLIHYFNYSEDNVDNAIGEIINLDGVSYTIVGFHYHDIALVSYIPYRNYGIHEYKNFETYLEFSNKLIMHMISEDYVNIMIIDFIFIRAHQSETHQALNYLITNYPSNNYHSTHYIQTLDRLKNEQLVSIIKIQIYAIAMGLSVAIILINRKVIKANLEIIEAYENHYIINKKMRIVYSVTQILMLTILSIIVFKSTLIKSSYKFILEPWGYIIIGIFVIPLSVVYMLGYKNE